MKIDDKFIQQTDRHPELFRYLGRILLNEKIHSMIIALPYLPKTYIQGVPNEKKDNRDILTLFDSGIIKTILGYRNTRYYRILTSCYKKQSFTTLLVFTLKFFKYHRHIKKQGKDLRNFLSPHAFRNPGSHIGKIVEYPVEKIIPTAEFNAYDKDILELFDKGFLQVAMNVKNTGYFHIQTIKRNMSLKKRLRWIYKYYKLYVSIKKRGYRLTGKGLADYPWVFESAQLTMRLDGHHRSAVATHLKLNKIPVLLVTPQDLKMHLNTEGTIFSEFTKKNLRRS